MKKIECLFIDDKLKDLKDDIKEWKKDLDSDYSNEKFQFFFEESNRDLFQDELIDKCLKYDFVVLDQMAESDKAGTHLAVSISKELKRKGVDHCIFTNHLGSDVRKRFKNIKIFKKSDIVHANHKVEFDCDGGFLDMLNYIENNTSFYKYCKFLRFTSKDFADFVRDKIYPLMQNYLNLDSKAQLDDLDTEILLKFTEGIREVLIDGNIIPNINYCNTTGGMITYLITRNPSVKKPNEGLTFLKQWMDDERSNRKSHTNAWKFLGRPEGEDSKYIIKSFIDEISLSRIMSSSYIDKKTAKEKFNYTYELKQNPETSNLFFEKLGIGENLKNTLIGQALDLIWIYRCSKGHGVQKDPSNHALKAVYESILLVLERLNIIFERIDELERLAVGIEDIDHFYEDKLKENPVEETSVSEEKQEEDKEDDNEDNYEENSEAAIEKGEDVIKNDDEKEKIPSYRQKLPDINIQGYIDLDKFK